MQEGGAGQGAASGSAAADGPPEARSHDHRAGVHNDRTPAAGPGAEPHGTPGTVAGTDGLPTAAGAPADASHGPLTIIGTGHVFRIDAAIRGAIHALRPDVVFVELDKGRLDALLHREHTGHAPARGGFVHQRLQRFQESVAQLYGAEVGNEMLGAVRAAHETGAQLALIDAPGEQTVKRALRGLTWRERMRAVGQVAGAGFKRLLPARKDARAAMEEEVKRYEDDPDAALEELRRQYPTVWRVLIDERDERMAAAIRRHLRGGRSGVAVLGDGHVPGVTRRLADLDVRVYRLQDVRGGRLPSPEGTASGTSQEVSFSFDLHVAPTSSAPDADAPWS